MTNAIHNKYQFKSYIYRNIILIGAEGAGKSTVANILGDDLFFMGAIQEKYYSTKNIAALTREYESILEMQNTFLDMVVSLIEEKWCYKQQRKIKEFLDAYITHDVTNVHIFALVFSLADQALAVPAGNPFSAVYEHPLGADEFCVKTQIKFVHGLFL
ncbi:hypothetical protein I4U23_005849 [Adineta vaga]|nr:hypothetical protein I4U23_005849 [Adineta vaga]